MSERAVDVSRCHSVSQVYADVESSPVNTIVVSKTKEHKKIKIAKDLTVARWPNNN